MFFLNINDNKFDHADRTFSAVARSWRNCQRDTSDVKVRPAEGTPLFISKAGAAARRDRVGT